MIDAIRAREWWEHKLAPMLGTAYATAFLLHRSLLDTAPALLAALVALAALAAYVSLINDLTDIEEDRRAGKRNRAAERSGLASAGAVTACVAVGAAVAIAVWRHDPAVIALYAAAWLAFTLYSVPPIRLKARGLAGAVADALGAHGFPHLFVAAGVIAYHDARRDAVWLAAVATWALAVGLRGAIWHQLSDRAADVAAGVATFGRRHPVAARRVGLYLAFPAELAALGVMLVHARGWIALVALVLYAALERRRTRRWRAAIVVVDPAPDGRYRIALHEYYIVLYPLAFLLAASLRHPADAIVLVAHLALFGHVAARMAGDAARELGAPRPRQPSLR